MKRLGKRPPECVGRMSVTIRINDRDELFCAGTALIDGVELPVLTGGSLLGLAGIPHHLVFDDWTMLRIDPLEHIAIEPGDRFCTAPPSGFTPSTEGPR